jgi:N-acetylglutamate synthase-like GNAT family acetyltransferase
MTTETRELKREEFFLAENVWKQYRGQKADPENERIFGVFENGKLVATARYTKHPDGVEMDCVFVSDTYRSKGYAREVVRELIRLCGQETIYIHSTLVLIRFYKTFGFTLIPEDQLPTTIRERFLFCFGEMEGCNICPMVRQGPAVF